MEKKLGVYHIAMVSRIPLEYELYEKTVDSREELKYHKKRLGKLVASGNSMHEMMQVIVYQCSKFHDFRVFHY